MDAFLCIASLRTVRRYSNQPVDEGAIQRIIDAGRVTGSAHNTQPWRFLVMQDREIMRAAAECVNRPSNLAGAPLAIGILLTEDSALTQFDAGRCAENMMIAAWNDGVGSAPNFVRHADRFRQILNLDEMIIATLLTMGYPKTAANPSRRSAHEWIERADRKSKANLIHEA